MTIVDPLMGVLRTPSNATIFHSDSSSVMAKTRSCVLYYAKIQCLVYYSLKLSCLMRAFAQCNVYSPVCRLKVEEPAPIKTIVRTITF